MLDLPRVHFLLDQNFNCSFLHLELLTLLADFHHWNRAGARGKGGLVDLLVVSTHFKLFMMPTHHPHVRLCRRIVRLGEVLLANC